MIETTKNNKGHHAFTLHESEILTEIVTECKVSLPWHPVINKGVPPPSLIETKALWDTGASHCVITKKLIDKLQIKPFRKVEVHHAGGKSESGIYKVNIILPNNMIIPYVNATEGMATAGNFDMIIGMDLITKGDFAITNVGGSTMMSFRMPSAVSIDFNDGKTTIIPNSIDGDGKQEEVVVKNYAGTPRNAKCPCGSNKKFKHCHGKQ